MGKRYFSKKVVEWYVGNKRPLPWRDTRDPYHVWLSEVILQQTRVAQGLPYYLEFIKRYPTIATLADAPEQEVLRLWQGLGYYTRARNLHKCARVIYHTYGGTFPTTAKALEALPGVGHYTAAAIASFAFGEAVAVVDGNVFRILSRIFGVDVPIDSPAGKVTFTTLASELLSRTDPALHNQAVMEFGALLCTPKNPRCEVCPFMLSCVAYNKGLIGVLPVKAAAKKLRMRYFFYVVVEKSDALLMRRRTEKDIWHGLFDFVLIETKRPVRPEKLIKSEEYSRWFSQARAIRISKRYRHVLTHQKIHCRFIHVQAPESFVVQEPALAFYHRPQIADLPKPVLISRFLREHRN